MTPDYDVIIIGAGPAGSCCAYTIKRDFPEARVLLLDKASFPRYKPCGGGISPEVQRHVDFDLTEGIDLVCRKVIMTAKGRRYTSERYPLWMVRRDHFDDFLKDKAVSLGVEFHDNSSVCELHQSDDGVICCVEGQPEIRARYAVIAEGAKGTLARKLGIAPHLNVFAALEYEHDQPNPAHELHLDFDRNDSGYAWNFPKSDGQSIGIGGMLKGKAKKTGLNSRLKAYFSLFQQTTDPHSLLQKQHLHGHPIKVYSGKQKLVHGNILLTGEIAGCVDPLSAEGIRPAMQSGILAGKEVAKALKDGNTESLVHYERAFHDAIGRDYQFARIASYLMNTHLNLVLPIVSSQRALNAILSVFSGDARYEDKIALRKIPVVLQQVSSHIRQRIRFKS